MTPINGFDAGVNVIITGLPTGVTATPSQFTVTAQNPQSVTIAAISSATAATTNLKVSGIGGDNTHSGQIALTVSAGSTPPNFKPTRTKYVQTDLLWDPGFLSFFPQPAIIYDSNSKRFFLSNTSLNQVDVFDAMTETEIATLPVPGAWIGDITTDHKTIYVGTQIGDVYAIDPVGLKVTMRFPSIQIGPSGYAAYEVHTLANGSLLLAGGQGGIPAVDGYSNIGIWNPSTNAFQQYASSYGQGQTQTGTAPICSTLLNIGELGVTADHTKVLLYSADSDGTICLFDPTTLSQQVTQYANYGFPLVPADGKEILTVQGNQITVFDSSTLQQTDQFTIGPQYTSNLCALSPDGNTLYAVDAFDEQGQAYNWRTHQRLGYFSLFQVDDTINLTAPLPMAVDETGLIASSIGHGIAFVDAGSLLSAPPAATGGYSYPNVIQPSVGPPAGGLNVNITAVETNNIENVSFGGATAALVSTGTTGVTVTPPPAKPGPVDVTVTATDGGLEMFPRGYTYAPSIIDVTTNATTADGGGTATVYGYGFGSAGENGQDPGMQITSSAGTLSNVQYSPQPYFNAYEATYPYPVESLQFTMPPGTAGQTVSLTATNSAGSVTESNAITYLPALKQYPLSGAVLAQGIYDSKRDVYYFSDQTQIRVFSKTKGAWLTSIAMPAGAQRLWGVSLSPNGKTLAVADTGAEEIYVLDPDTPTSVKHFGLPTSMTSEGDMPAAVGVTDGGVVYFTTFNLGVTGAPGLHKLVISSGTITDFPGFQSLALGEDAYMRMLVANDNTRVFVNFGEWTFSIDTATDATAFNPITMGYDYELAMASNQTWLAGNEWLMDTNFNPVSVVTYTDRQSWNETAVYGEKLSADGNLLFVPLENSLDIMDGKLGGLITRVALPVSLSPNYDALVSDGVDNVLIAITGQNGAAIAVVDLTSIQESIPQPWQSSRVLPMHAVSGTLKPTSAQAVKHGAEMAKLFAVSRPRRPVHITNSAAFQTPKF
jgi:WD40 repeat protein